MKLALVFTSIFLASTSALAMVNGTPVDWKQNDNIIRLDSVLNDNNGRCTGTLIAGKFVLTAAHCIQSESDIDRVMTAVSIGQPVDFSQFHSHPKYVHNKDFAPYDVGIVTLNHSVEYRYVQYFSSLPRSPFTADMPISIAGFGGTAYYPSPLNRVDFTFSHADITNPALIFANQVDLLSHTTGGDSGSAWTSAQDELIGIHKGSDSTVGIIGRETYGSDLFDSRQFILDTVNGWHYPTLTYVTGRKTIEIQSLHNDAGGIDFALGSNETGDVSIIREESSCFTELRITPFEKCSIVVESNGGEGQLQLSTTEFIQLNKPVPVEPTQPSGGGSSSGGSMSVLSILALFSLGFVRNRKKNVITA
jgi:hypothetical protein